MEVKSDIMKIKEEPLVDKEYLLEKIPGKGWVDLRSDP